MKNYLFVILGLSILLFSCERQNEADLSLTPAEYQKMGMPDYSKVWSLEDYSNACFVLNTLKYEKPKALPTRDSEKSGVLVSRMINMDNLTFLQDETLPLHAKAEIIQWYGNTLIELTTSYTFFNAEKQYYIRELADIDLFGLRIAQVMLDLGNEINASEDPEDIAMQSDFPLIQQMYLDLLSDLFKKQQNQSQYPQQTLELLSDSLSTSVRKNMHWFDENASASIKQAMLKVIDSSSSRKIKDEYRELTEIL